LFIFVARKTPSLAAADRTGDVSGSAEMTPFDRRTIIHIFATSFRRHIVACRIRLQTSRVIRPP